jgi:hypothetical protein
MVTERRLSVNRLHVAEFCAKGALARADSLADVRTDREHHLDDDDDDDDNRLMK